MALGFLRRRLSLVMLFESLKRAMLRFPWVFLSAFATGIVSTYAVDQNKELYEAQISLSLALGIPLFLTMSLLRESRGWTKLQHQLVELALGVSFITAHYFLTSGDTTDNYMIKYLHLSLLLHLAVSFVAFLQTRGDQEFWQFNRRIFIRILTSILYSGVFYVGIALASAVIQKLFGVKIPGEFYFNLWLFATFGIQASIFLAGVPELPELSKNTEYPRGLRIFVQFLLIPLVTLYMLILYVYMGKILITSDWPTGYIGWLVSAFSVLGVFNLLLIDPEKNSTENRWIASYSKIYYVLILPLLAMLFVAVGKRISEYGVTEQRYFLLILGALLVGLAIYFIFSKRKSIKAVPISLFALGLIVFFGPWSAYDASLRSQSKRAESLLQKYKLLGADGKVSAKAEMTFEDAKDLSSILNYIIQLHDLKHLRQWFPDGELAKVAKKDGPDELAPEEVQYRDLSSSSLMEFIGSRYINEWERNRNRSFSLHDTASDETFSIGDYGSAVMVKGWELEGGAGKKIKHKGRELNLRLIKDSAKMYIVEKSSDINIEINFAPLIVERVKLAKEKDRADKNASMYIDASGKDIKARLLIFDVNGRFEGEGAKIDSLNAILLIR